MPIAECTRVPARNRHWIGHLLLSITDDTAEHEASGHRGTYNLSARILTIVWRHFAPETFLNYDGVYVEQSLTGHKAEIDEIAFVRFDPALVSVRGVSVAVPLTSHEVFLRLGTSDVPVFRQVFTMHEYRSDHLPDSARAIVDLGANIGLATVFFGLRYKQARVLAVEPEPGNFALLARNTAALGDRVRRIEGAAWIADGPIALHTESDAGQDLDAWGPRVSAPEARSGKTTQGHRLTTLLDAAGFDRVDILKIDIEGAELDLFTHGADRWLPRVDFIMVETHDRFRPGSDAAVRQALAPGFEELPNSGENLVFRRLSPTTLSEVGAVVTAIEMPGAFDGRGTVSLGMGFPTADFFQRVPTTAVLSSYVLSDVVCSIPSMLIHAGGRAIRETAYLLAEDALSGSAPSAAEIELCEVSQTVVQGLCGAWNNYYHWVAQCLPALLAAGSAGAGKILALPSLTPRQEETLHLLGIQDHPRFKVESGRSYRFRSLEISDFILGRSSFEISMILRDVYRVMKQRVRAEKLAGPKLYLSRRGAGHRRLHNEADLTELLLRRGFDVVDPGAFTIAQQINLFRNAEAVVAPHGAALTNIGFCEPGTKIYELLPVTYPNACFNRIAQLAELAYAADVGPSDAGSKHAFQASFSVDMELVSSRLDALGL